MATAYVCPAMRWVCTRSRIDREQLDHLVVGELGERPTVSR